MILTVIMLNLTNFAWNLHDAKIMKLADKRCFEMYETGLSRFTKKGKRDYVAICK